MESDSSVRVDDVTDRHTHSHRDLKLNVTWITAEVHRAYALVHT